VEIAESAVRAQAAVPQPSFITGQQRTIPEQFIDADVAATFLSIPRRRVLEFAREGLIPAYPLGEGARRVWRFRLSTLAIAMEARLHCGRQSPAPNQETI
jgi:hypothetical protein